MTRWLLNTFPSWALALLLVGGLVALAWAGFKLSRRRLPHLSAGENNDVAGVMLGILVGVYGIVLAFVIVALYEGFQAAEQTVHAEATELAQLTRDVRAFESPAREAVLTSIGRYAHAVVEDEWTQMEAGRESRAAWHEIDELYRIFQSYAPKREPAITFYGEAVGKLNELVGARRDRLNASQDELPAEFQILIVGGALMLIFFLYVLSMPNERAHLFMVLAVSALLGFNLLLAVVLDHPFSGDITVSFGPFKQGALAVFWP